MDWLDLIYLAAKIPGREPVIYNFARPLIGAWLDRSGYTIVPNGKVEDGPGLLVGSHLFAIDPVVTSFATPKRLVILHQRPDRGKRGYELSHAIVTLVGINVRSPNFSRDLYRAWDAKMTALVFPEGDVPGSQRKEHDKRVDGLRLSGGLDETSMLLDTESIPVKRWDPTIFKMVKGYEASRNVAVNCQPVGLRYGKARYNGDTTYPTGQKIYVSFGSGVKSSRFNGDAADLGYVLMGRAAFLSNRPFNGHKFYTRLNRESNK